MIYKYTIKRANQLKKIMHNIPGRRRRTDIIFNGANNFKFIYRGRSIEVSNYDQEIIIRYV